MVCCSSLACELISSAVAASSSLLADLSTLDASLGYHLNKQITVSLDVTNLLNQAYHDYFDKNPSMVRDVRYYDRTVGLSLRWKL